MVEGIISLVIAIICLVYSIFAFQEKGPLLSTMYFIAKDKEQYKMENKKEYQFVATIFLLIAIIFAVSSIGVIFNIAWVSKISYGIMFVLVVYAFIISVKHVTRK